MSNSKKKRTELDRQIDLRQGIENQISSIFYSGIKNQEAFNAILDKISNYKNNYSSFSTLPRYMQSQIRGREEGLFAIIDWWFVESRFNYKGSYITKEEIKGKEISWSEVKYVGSFWKDKPNKPYSLEKEEENVSTNKTSS